MQAGHYPYGAQKQQANAFWGWEGLLRLTCEERREERRNKRNPGAKQFIY
jgi:hypothetical protein